MGKRTLSEEWEDLDAALHDLAVELGRAFGFDWAKRHRINPWFWGVLLILIFDVAVKLTTMGLDAICGGRCL